MNKTVSSDRWADLFPRLASALVMLLLGGAAIRAGGGWFAALVVLACALMSWELARMTRGEGFDASVVIAVLAAAVLALNLWAPVPWFLPFLLLPALIGTLAPRRDLLAFAPYALLIMLCGLALVMLREIHGMGALVWLLAVVIASDVLGYFAGRSLGGPKFWPAISPKKTWSGTLAGWIGALAIGLYCWGVAGWPLAVVWAAPLIAFAGQLGDIAESAIKRRAGVKDASNLIPGHGGLMDRFDALLFASIMVLLLNQFAPFLPVAVKG
ncbi:phosphatidate cytidylyltransferase [Pseudogemmobacter faecipullorum]|uniref:Phosphatidate cytidylyltransferase n=1 Tax=Pseudogemmobacter faecipullorum TaxID=2755041 RepID=A0ABS8CK53_9RHOB|nr:phosphatidate cytidylyltransferase [Pseudogemmobacter faecipullorum]MCB5409773.1 phosphatidate cytidylyltransferase [Pseudogemmobacter faecipullorum]